MTNFKRINNIAGWIIFVISSMVYLLTMEPTVSFWDCGEFIASSYKLEVGHPPGNPVFQLIGRVFSMFVAPQYVAPMINATSALCSSATILLLFWSITHIARRLMERNKETFTTGNIIAIIGTGVVGALAYTFSDTFWFSAVEAEVYAMSSLFTAVVFWAILKWEEEADRPYAGRWLILIAYLMGLSLGVHLLNLLAIPAIVFIYYFKKYTVSKKGIFWALLISCGLILLMLLFIPTIPKIAGYVDLFFVNSLGLPFNSGAIFAFLGLMALAVYGMIYARKHNKAALNSAFLMFIVAMIGYSTFAVVVIRSNANTPTNENQPDNPFSLLYYLNREQYGSAPLLSGPSYATAATPVSSVDKYTYIKDKGKYRKIKGMPDYEYEKRYNMFFPRMHSYEPTGAHKQIYQQYLDPNRRNVQRNPYNDEVIPSFKENLHFFFDYQISWMYIRYFMWNFAGRQNDIQGDGSSYYGNWECGIPFIDKIHLGEAAVDKPPYLAENKAQNHYYMLPLLLGLIGLFYQLKKDKRNFAVVMMLFILTGVAVIVYLNQTPLQPRERDYGYGGSFYAFTIWIGLGVYAIYDWIRKKTAATIAASVAGVIGVIVPLQMAAENWDDHDRSDRYTARDVAYNYLQSCDKNAILFSGGDNDTFPLWYAQEVEGVRTDVRIVNLSLATADWYIDQMKYRMYDSPPVPFKLDRENYLTGINDFIPVQDQLKGTQPLSLVMEFLSNPRYRARTQGGDLVSYIPTKNIGVPVDKETLLNNGIVPQKYAGNLLDTMVVGISENSIRKPDMMILDLLQNNRWERPINFVSMGADVRLNFKNYYQYEGYTYKLLPLRTQETNVQMGGSVDTDELYEKMMHVFRWGNMNKPGIFVDHYNSLYIAQILNWRNMHARLAEALVQEGKNDKAVEVLDSAMVRVPTYNFPCNISARNNEIAFMSIIQLYYRLGEMEKANALSHEFIDATEKNIIYFAKLRDGAENLNWNLICLQQMVAITNSPNKELSEKTNELLERYAQMTGY